MAKSKLKRKRGKPKGVAALGYKIARFEDNLFSNPSGTIPTWLLIFIIVICGLLLSKTKSENGEELGLTGGMVVATIIVTVGYVSMVYQAGKVRYRCGGLKGAARRACRMNALRQNQILGAIRRRR